MVLPQTKPSLSTDEAATTSVNSSPLHSLEHVDAVQVAYRVSRLALLSWTPEMPQTGKDHNARGTLVRTVGITTGRVLEAGGVVVLDGGAELDVDGLTQTKQEIS